MGLRRDIQDLKRLEQILVVLVESGFGFLLAKLDLMGRVPVLKRFSHRETVPTPERVRKTFEQLGPTFIKFGQILAQRPDIVPEEYIAELEKLEDAVPPFDPAVARQIVEEDLGPVEEVFKTFEEEPLAAASIAQVHRATLHNGEEVVVKVRRPGIKDQMEKDLDILQFLAKRGEKHIKKLRSIRTHRAAKEFARWTRDELDLRKEGRNGEVFRQNLADEDRVKVPKVYREHNTERVLVMEYVEGVKSNDVAALQELDIDAEEIAATAVRAGIKQVIRDGFFHADPHPSNFLVSPEGKLIYLDFGMIGKFSKNMRRNLGLLLLHALNEDVDGALETITRMATVENDADLDGLKDDVEEVMMMLRHTTIQEQSITMILLEIASRANQRGVYMPPQLTIMGKGMLTMEGIGLTIYPEFEIGDEYREVVQHLLWELNSPTDLAKTFFTDLVQNRDLIARAPSKLNALIDGISEQKVETTVTVEHESGRKAILVGALLLSSTILLAQTLPTDQLLVVAAVELGLALLLLLWAF